MNQKERKLPGVRPLVLKCDTYMKNHKELDEPLDTKEAKTSVIGLVQFSFNTWLPPIVEVVSVWLN